MGRVRRTFTIGFKQQVVSEIESGMISNSEACRKYEVGYAAILRWRKKLSLGELSAKPSRHELALAMENEKLKAKVGELTLEIDLLKKFRSWVEQRRNAATSVITAKNLGQLKEDAGCSA